MKLTESVYPAPCSSRDPETDNAQLLYSRNVIMRQCAFWPELQRID